MATTCDYCPRSRHGVPPAYSGPTGKGAIVAIIDTGVDIFHADFRHEDGSSRVITMWDQYAPGSSAEVPVGQVYRDFSATEDAEVVAALESARARLA